MNDELLHMVDLAHNRLLMFQNLGLGRIRKQGEGCQWPPERMVW